MDHNSLSNRRPARDTEVCEEADGLLLSKLAPNEASASDVLKTSAVDGGDGGRCGCVPAATRRSCCACCSRARTALLQKYSTKPGEGDSIAARLRYAFLCPPHGAMATAVCLGMAGFLTWALLWSVLGVQGLPGGTFFGLWSIFVACHAAAWLVVKAHLPGLLGMLIVGCILGNVPPLDVARHVDSDWSSALRTSALGIILLRAGLGLNPADLRRLSFTVVRLAFLPCITEAVTCMIASHLLLGMPWMWGLMLGFVLAAVSPAVVVPSMLALQERSLGVEHGIPTLVLAAASIDDILAISAFGVILGIALGKTDDMAMTIVRGPLEALGGVVYGIGVGVLLWYLPAASSKDAKTWRLLLLLGFGQLALFGSQAVGMEGAGALGCLVLAFVAGYRWRKEAGYAGPSGGEVAAESTLRTLWHLWQPFLFGLIGAAVDVTTIAPDSLGLSVAVLFIGLAFRTVAAYLAVFGAGLDHKQRLFISLAWLPKATVQAAIGSVAYDAAHRIGSTEGMALGKHILTIAVLSIIVTAPLGAGAIAISAPRLLRRRDTSPAIEEPSTAAANDSGNGMEAAAAEA